MIDAMDLYRMAEEDNITIDRFPIKTRDALSYMDADGSCYVAIDPGKIKGALDEKMKIAHELGHCYTGAFYNRWAAVECRRKHENAADKWAIRQFLNENDLDDAVASGYVEIWELAEFFCVSEDFMKKAVCLYTYGNVATEMYF